MKYIVVLQVFAPTFQRCTMLFRSLMNRFQISEEEIVALFGLLFWNERKLSLSECCLNELCLIGIKIF